MHLARKNKNQMRFKDELQRQIYYRSQIDYSYWRIQEISKHNAKMQSPLEALIDKASGFEEAQVLERIEEVKCLASVVIRCKKKLDYETDADKDFLKAIRKLHRETKSSACA